jgi:hypothetical protein
VDHKSEINTIEVIAKKKKKQKSKKNNLKKRGKKLSKSLELDLIFKTDNS